MSETKSDIKKFITEFMRGRVQYHLGPLSEARYITYPEGTGRQDISSSGIEPESKFAEISTKMIIKNEELLTITLESLLQKTDESARSIPKQGG